MTDIMRIALTVARTDVDGVIRTMGIVINENADELYCGPGRTNPAIAQADANRAAEELAVPKPWDVRRKA